MTGLLLLKERTGRFVAHRTRPDRDGEARRVPGALQEASFWCWVVPLPPCCWSIVPAYGTLEGTI